MPDANVQLKIEIETEGAEQLTTLRRDLEQVGAAGTAAFARLDASLRAALDQQRRFAASVEPIFQNFFQRLLTGATGFRDTFKRLFDDLLRFFVGTVSRMVAAWLGGLRQMLGGGGIASSGAGGSGLLGGLIAPLLSSGFGFRLGVAGTPPFVPAGGGGGSATHLGILSELGINLRGLGPISGCLLFSGGLLAGLFGVQRGSPVLGALGGAAAGFAVGGPIGAVVGALVGLIGGVFSRGGLKRRAAALEEVYTAELGRILRAVKSFELTPEQAIAQVQASFEGFAAEWARLGGPGRRALEKMRGLTQQVVASIRNLAGRRDLRTQLVQQLPIPEFQRGGLVRALPITGPNSRILAFLHPGEAVLNRRAVASLGPQNVERLNRAGNSSGAPSFQSGGFVNSMSNPVAPLSRAESRDATGKVNIQIVINAADRDPREIAHEVIRTIRRLARDQGLPRPV